MVNVYKTEQEADGLAERVDVLRCRGEVDLAEEAARNGLESFPKNVGLAIALGRVMLATGRYDKALAEFGQAAGWAPGDPRPVAWRIATLSRRCDFPVAFAEGAKALDDFPTNIQIRVAVARVYMDASRPQDAITLLEEAVRMAPSNRGAVLWRAACRAMLYEWPDAVSSAKDAVQMEEAERDARDALRRYSLAKAYWGMGRVLVAAQQYEHALGYLADAIEADPGYPKPWEWRISALRGLYLYHEAEHAVTEALEKFPREAGLHIEASWLFSDQGEHDQAVYHANRACELNEKSPSAQATRIEILCNAYLFGEAHDVARKALSACGRSPRVHTALALAYAEQRRWDEALREVEAALKIDGSYWWALRSKVEFLRRTRRFEEALQAAEDAVCKRPYDPRVYIAKGWVLSRQGMYGKALEAADEALRHKGLGGKDSWALYSKLHFLRQARRFSEAEEAVTEALDMWRKDPDLLVAAAWIASDQDEEELAAERATRAVETNPRHAGALAARLYFLRWARKFEEAKQAAREALKARPGDPLILAAAGWVYSDLDEHEQALAFIEEACRKSPNDSWLVTCRVNFLRAAGQPDDAEKVASEALARGEFRDDPYLLTAAGWMHGDRDQYPAALEKFDQALRHCPTHLDALQWKTVVLRCLMEPERAMVAAEHAIQLRSEDAELVIELGRTYEARNAFAEALGQYDAVLGGDPGNVDALVAKSSALRSLRRNRDAEREVGKALGQKRTNRDLMAERGWIQYDQRNLTDAKAIFENLLATAVNNRERALASYGLGWVAFVGRDYITAATRFSAAIDEKRGWPDNLSYQLGLAWALAKRDGRPELWDQAEGIARHVADSRQDPVAHVCLGFIGYRRDDLASAEYHLSKALEIDPQHGSYTDLGAFYLHTGRYPEAQETLAKAIARDWHDVVAHVEMGCLHWALGDGHLADAEYEFRQARAIAPGSVRATTGLARTLVMQGKDVEAEKVLREALVRIDGRKKWRVHLVLARLLARQGNLQQDEALLAEAFDYAKKAINGAPEESEPQVVAGVVQFHWAGLIHEPVRREDHYRQARKFLKASTEGTLMPGEPPLMRVPPVGDPAYYERYGGRSPRADRAESEAMRYLAALKGERSRVEPALWGGILLASISLGVLLVMWTMFFATDKISDTLITVNTPVLVGLIGISALLPALIRLKVPGMEADLQPSYATEIVGPSGDDSFGPGRLSVPIGPAGQIPQLGEGRLQHAKNTRHS
jgi:tetratricopeptide (TPR) repeat protein